MYGKYQEWHWLLNVIQYSVNENLQDLEDWKFTKNWSIISQFYRFIN